MSAQAKIQALATPKPAALSEAEYARGEGYRLYRGDSLALMGQFEAQSFDLIFADPPYFLSNGGFTCKGGKRVSVDKGGWDVSRGVDDDHAFTMEWLAACQRLLKPSGTLWVSGTHHVIFNVGFAMQRLGMKLLNTVTWYKPNASPNLSCRYFTHSTEILLWASPGGKGKLRHTFNYQAMKAENGGKQMRDVWALPKAGDEELTADGEGRVWSMITPRAGEKKHGNHPTQKPLSLLRRVVEASSEPDALVLDPFCGSGTTGVAALELGRRFVGLEMDEAHLGLSNRRMQAVVNGD